MTPSGLYGFLHFRVCTGFLLSHTFAVPAGGELLTSGLNDEFHRGGSSGSATVPCKLPAPLAGAAPSSIILQGQPVLSPAKPEEPAKPAHLGPR